MGQVPLLTEQVEVAVAEAVVVVVTAEVRVSVQLVAVDAVTKPAKAVARGMRKCISNKKQQQQRN